MNPARAEQLAEEAKLIAKVAVLILDHAMDQCDRHWRNQSSLEATADVRRATAHLSRCIHDIGPDDEIETDDPLKLGP